MPDMDIEEVRRRCAGVMGWRLFASDPPGLLANYYADKAGEFLMYGRDWQPDLDDAQAAMCKEAARRCGWLVRVDYHPDPSPEGGQCVATVWLNPFRANSIIVNAKAAALAACTAIAMAHKAQEERG